MKAMLLAAGESRSLRPLTATVPKPMVEIAGRPILEHNVRLLAQHGIREMVINLHYYPVKVMDHFGDGSRFGVSIIYSYEAEPLGTAGAVRRVEDLLTETFLVVYADDLSACDIGRLVRHHEKKGATVTLAVTKRQREEEGPGVVLDAEDRIQKFITEPQVQGERGEWVGTGIWVLDPAVHSVIPENRPSDFKRDILPALLSAKRPLYGYRMTEGYWRIDSPSDYARVRALAETGGIPLP